MSTPQLPPAPSPRRDKPVNRWHRNAGVAAAGVLVYLLATGVPLQFSAQLDLGRRFVSAAWILDWYGLTAPERVTTSGDVVQVGQWLFVDQRPVTTMNSLVGAITLQDFTMVAGVDEVVLLHTDAAQAPEKTRLNASISRIGRWQATPYLDTDDGFLAADAVLLNWHPAALPAGDMKWAEVTELGEPAAAGYRRSFRTRMLTVERWLQDLHSGRFFGPVGVLIIDLVSALLLVLAGTGMVLWWRFRNA